MINSSMCLWAPDEDEGSAMEGKGAIIGSSVLLHLEVMTGLSVAAICTLGGGSGGETLATNSVAC